MTSAWSAPDLVNRTICLDCCFGRHTGCAGSLNKRERTECPCECQLLKKAAA